MWIILVGGPKTLYFVSDMRMILLFCCWVVLLWPGCRTGPEPAALSGPSFRFDTKSRLSFTTLHGNFTLVPVVCDSCDTANVETPQTMAGKPGLLYKWELSCEPGYWGLLVNKTDKHIFVPAGTTLLLQNQDKPKSGKTIFLDAPTYLPPKRIRDVYIGREMDMIPGMVGAAQTFTGLSALHYPKAFYYAGDQGPGELEMQLFLLLEAYLKGLSEPQEMPISLPDELLENISPDFIEFLDTWEEQEKRLTALASLPNFCGYALFATSDDSFPPQVHLIEGDIYANPVAFRREWPVIRQTIFVMVGVDPPSGTVAETSYADIDLAHLLSRLEKDINQKWKNPRSFEHGEIHVYEIDHKPVQLAIW